MHVDDVSEVRYLRIRIDDLECEAPVLTNEAIEVHLSYLRPALEATKVDKIKALDEKLRAQ